METNKFIWHNREDELPPLNVPVLCKVEWTREMNPTPHMRSVFYQFAVHWRMDDGQWEFSERAKRITHWAFINFNGELITTNDKKYQDKFYIYGNEQKQNK